MTRTFAYCPFAFADAASKLGWVILGPLPFPHGVYAFLVEWQCDCPVRYWGRITGDAPLFAEVSP
jgi:hypothetical protein